ncbi:MAG: glutaredoxin family protein [Microbacterium sp.]
MVYTTGDTCVQCRLTKQVMDAVGLVYAAVDLTDPNNAAARDYVTEDLGHSAAPVVVVDDHDHWAGFRPDRIKQLATLIDASPSSQQG